MLIILLVIFSFFSICNANNTLDYYILKPTTSKISIEKFRKDSIKPFDISVAYGFGLDYGGLGVNLLITPIKYLSIFGGVGYPIIDLGYNIGARLNIAPNTLGNFHFIGMYGYNSIVYIKNARQFNKMFFGPSFGIGVDIRTNSRRKTYLTLSLLYPVRKDEVFDYMEDLKKNHNISFYNSLNPLTLSLGLRIN